GASTPRPMPARMPSPTHTLRKRSNRPISAVLRHGYRTRKRVQRNRVAVWSYRSWTPQLQVETTPQQADEATGAAATAGAAGSRGAAAGVASTAPDAAVSVPAARSPLRSL